MRYEFGTVVGTQDGRITTIGSNLLESSNNACSRKREVDLEGKRFAREVVNDRQEPNAAAADETIAEKVDRPSLVRTRYGNKRCTALVTPVALTPPCDRQSVGLVRAI